MWTSLCAAALTVAAPAPALSSASIASDLALLGVMPATSVVTASATPSGASAWLGEEAEGDDAAVADTAEGAIDDASEDADAPVEDFDRDAAIAAASLSLQEMDNIAGRFVQIGYDGSVEGGDFYLDRPGKVRFEYDEPHPSLIVSDGATVAHQDRELDTIDRAPLRQTPLHLILRRDVDLSRDAEILAVERRGDVLGIVAADPDGELDETITLVFEAPALRLREWIVTDALGQETRVVLTQLRVEDRLDPALFVLRDDRPRRGF